MTYLVAGLHAWSRDAFRALEKLPGDWRFISDPKELTKELLGHLTPRYVFFLHWSEKVPAEIVQNYECVAFHMTDLPYGRGGSPLQNLIIRGHKETQLCALRMTEHFDAGPIYMRRPLPLAGRAEDIYRSAMELGAQMAREIAEKEPKPMEQSGTPTVFRRRKPEESRISGQKNLEQLYDFIRMLDAEGYPHAFLEQEGFRFRFRRATLADGNLRAEVEILPTADDTESTH